MILYGLDVEIRAKWTPSSCLSTRGGVLVTLEDNEKELWKRWEGVESPDTFSFLELAKDGGFSEIDELYIFPHQGWIAARAPNRVKK